MRYLLLTCLSLAFSLPAAYAQETVDAENDSPAITTSAQSDNAAAMQDMEDMMADERANFQKTETHSVSTENSADNSANNSTDNTAINTTRDVNESVTENDSVPQKTDKTTNDPFSGHGLRMELFGGYIPQYAGLAGLNIGYKFKNVREHFALGLYGQWSYGIGGGYSLYPTMISFDINAIVKFHFIYNRFVISPFIGGGFGIDGMMIFLFPVGFFYLNLRTGLSLDWHVGKRGYIGLDLGIVEAFSSAYMSSEYFDKHNCSGSDSTVCNVPYPTLPQAYVAVHFGLYFKHKSKK